MMLNRKRETLLLGAVSFSTACSQQECACQEARLYDGCLGLQTTKTLVDCPDLYALATDPHSWDRTWSFI